MTVVKSKITLSQLNRLSEIFGNISVAWFTAGVIAPLFTKIDSNQDVFTNVLLSLAMIRI
ncbi:MAG: hypothetical protein AAB559_03215 [Patescibacteria group bacterium]